MSTLTDLDGTPLVSADWMEDRLDDPTVRVIEIDSDTSFGDMQPYSDGHIPGAVRWEWRSALWHRTDRKFPGPREMAERLGAIGIDETDTIVIASDRAQWATYAYWVMTMSGIENVRVLDVVQPMWVAQGRPTSRSLPRFETVEYDPGSPVSDHRVGRRNVREHLDDDGRLLLDGRSLEEYRGERVKPPHAPVDHGAQRWGHIPGATHAWYREFLHDDDRYRSIDDIAEAFSLLGIDIETESREIVTYCRLSHRGSFLWFVLHHLLGYDDVKVYDGSWTEWGSIVGYPVEVESA